MPEPTHPLFFLRNIWTVPYLPNNFLYTLWNKSFNSEKIQPNLIPSKIIPIGWVDLNSKKKFAICHWTWEIGWIWHFLKKSGDKILAVSYRIAVFFDKVRATSRKLGKIAMSYQMLMLIIPPDFPCKCQINFTSQIQWQIANFILEFKCTHPIGINFD